MAAKILPQRCKKKMFGPKSRPRPLHSTYFRAHNSLASAVAQWSRCCATNRKVADSIPEGVTGIFHWHNPSDRTMAFGSRHPVTEMSTRSISWVQKAACAWGWQPYHHPGPLSRNLGTLTSLNRQGTSSLLWDWYSFVHWLTITWRYVQTEWQSVGNKSEGSFMPPNCLNQKDERALSENI